MIIIVVLCSSIILCILLLVYIYNKKKSVEHYQNTSEHILNKIKNTSTVIYSKKENFNDSAFYQSYKNSVNNSSEILIMDRCIELKQGAFDKICNMENISYGKIKIPYTAFSDIQTVIVNTLNDIYTNKMSKYINTFSGLITGPVYVLITQYPFLRKVDNNCSVSTITLNIYNETKTNNIYKPHNIKSSVGNNCNSTILKLQTTPNKIECEICLLFPYNMPSSHLNTRWADIKKNMEFLLDKDLVINPRSQENQCFVKCGTISPDGYACGAKNSEDKKPYESIVSSSLVNNKDTEIFSDFANLYVINPQIVNNYLGVNIIEDGINRETLLIPPSVLPPRKTLHQGTLNFTDINIIETNSDRDAMNTALSSITSLLTTIENIAKSALATTNTIEIGLADAKHQKQIIIDANTSTTTSSYNAAKEAYAKIEKYKADFMISALSISSEITAAKTARDSILTNAVLIENTFPTEAYILISSIKSQAEEHIKSIEVANPRALQLSRETTAELTSAITYKTSLQTIIDNENTVLNQRDIIKRINTEISTSEIISKIQTNVGKVLSVISSNATISVSYTTAASLMAEFLSKINLSNVALGIAKEKRDLAKTANANSYYNEANKIVQNIKSTYAVLEEIMIQPKIKYTALKLDEMITNYIALFENNTKTAESAATSAALPATTTIVSNTFATTAETCLANINSALSEAININKLDLMQLPSYSGRIAAYKARTTTAATNARNSATAKRNYDISTLIPKYTNIIKSNMEGAENEATNAQGAHRRRDADTHANNSANYLNNVNSAFVNSKNEGLDLTTISATEQNIINAYRARAVTAATNARNYANANQRTWESGRMCRQKGHPSLGDLSSCERYCMDGYSAHNNDWSTRYCGRIPSGAICTIEGRSYCDRSFNNGCGNCVRGMGRDWFDNQCDAKCA